MMDWDKAYDNRAAVPDFPEYLERWSAQAQKFREEMFAKDKCELSLRYGDRERNVADLFLPDGPAQGLVIYVHGGYWRSLDKTYWSHLAKGALKHGWAVGIPSYTLAPQARITEIVDEIASATMFLSERVAGDIRMIGHSAGGHLVARLLCDDAPLSAACKNRIAHTVAVSGVFDLEHLPKTKMNDDLKIDDEEIHRQSPARLKCRGGVSITCLVGGNEIPEFHRQNELLDGWRASGGTVDIRVSEGKNHFSVVEPLEFEDSEILKLLLG